MRSSATNNNNDLGLIQLYKNPLFASSGNALGNNCSDESGGFVLDSRNLRLVRRDRTLDGRQFSQAISTAGFRGVGEFRLGVRG